MKRILVIATICLMAATAVHAQSGGGGGGGGGRRGGGGGKGGRTPSTDPAPAASTPAQAQKPEGKTEIVGVVQAIDADAGRVTIAYEASDAINWPAGVMPFVVSKNALLKDVTVGEKVRFSLDSQQIATLRPFAQDADAP
jgi:Cu/Ag efflux protein CusF